MLLGTISDRQDYVSPGEKFEDVTMLLFRPMRTEDDQVWVKLYRATPNPELREITEAQYFDHLRDLYNLRNPHAQIGLEELKAEGEDTPPD